MIAGEIMSSSPLPRSVRRALDAMRANVGRDWRLAELAKVAGVSERTLQRQFQNFLGKSPVAVLRDIGFERARRDLLCAGPTTRITDVALACGFPHCGRFAVEYRRRYGETPSQTLKRQAGFRPRWSRCRHFALRRATGRRSRSPEFRQAPTMRRQTTSPMDWRWR